MDVVIRALTFSKEWRFHFFYVSSGKYRVAFLSYSIIMNNNIIFCKEANAFLINGSTEELVR